MSGHAVQALVAAPREVSISGRSVDEDVGAPSMPWPVEFARARPQAGGTFRRLVDRQFRMMDDAFSRTGGCVAESVFQHRWRRAGQTLSSLADRIQDRSIISFEWQSRTLVPLFQFVASDMTLRSETAAVVRELVDVFDHWELALWFAQPNGWLAEATPVDLVAHDPAAVFRAARADRFIAHG